MLNYSSLVLSLSNFFLSFMPFVFQKQVDVFPYDFFQNLFLLFMFAVTGPTFFWLIKKGGVGRSESLPGKLWSALLAVQAVCFLMTCIVELASGISLERSNAVIFEVVVFGMEIVIYCLTFQVQIISWEKLEAELEKKRIQETLTLEE